MLRTNIPMIVLDLRKRGIGTTLHFPRVSHELVVFGAILLPSLNLILFDPRVAAAVLRDRPCYQKPSLVFGDKYFNQDRHEKEAVGKGACHSHT